MSPATVTATKVAAGTYKYTVKFNVPQKCLIPYEKVVLTGNFAADNSAKVYLDGSQIASCTPTQADPKLCFKTTHPLNGTVTQPGNPHTLVVDVMNNEAYSGLLVDAKLTGECKKK